MCQVRNEVAVTRLLLHKLVGLDASCLLEVLLEGGLAWQLAKVDLLRPEGMLSQMLPADSLDRIFLQQSSEQVIEHDRA